MEKEQFLRFKEDLKAKAQEQKSVKAQRKTEHFKGERTMCAYDAQWEAERNRVYLDNAYVAYYIVKHRWEWKTKKEIDSQVDKTEQDAMKAYNEYLIKSAYERTHGGREIAWDSYDGRSLIRDLVYDITKIITSYEESK